jgi:hypothetical protein
LKGNILPNFEINTKIYLNKDEQTAIQTVVDEYCRAIQKFGPFNSAHEGYAIIKEELDELWDEVKKKQGERELDSLKNESMQVAAMGLRFLIDVAQKNVGFK